MAFGEFGRSTLSIMTTTRPSAETRDRAKPAVEKRRRDGTVDTSTQAWPPLAVLHPPRTAGGQSADCGLVVLLIDEPEAMAALGRPGPRSGPRSMSGRGPLTGVCRAGAGFPGGDRRLGRLDEFGLPAREVFGVVLLRGDQGDPVGRMLIVSPAAAAAPPKRLRAACFEIPRTVPISPQLRP
jgi:hypothetical protein